MNLFNLSLPAWELILRAIVIDVVMLVALRVFGKREIGQFTLYDLVLILLVANAVQPAMTGPDTSLSGGLIIIGVLVLFNFLLGRLDRYRFFHRLLVAPARVIIRDGRYIEPALLHEGVDQEECETAIRAHGIADVGEVQLGVLEPDGTISIIPKEGQTQPVRRRVRYVRRG